MWQHPELALTFPSVVAAKPVLLKVRRADPQVRRVTIGVSSQESGSGLG